MTFADADGAVRMGREPRDTSGGIVVRGPQRERHDPDWLIMLIVVALAAVGILMVYSSTAVRFALDPDGDLLRALVPELAWAGLGIGAMLLFWRLDYRWLRVISVPGFLIALALLVIVLSPVALGPIRPLESGGSSRWLAIGALPQMHPAELAKLGMVVYLAHWFARRGHAAGSLTTGTIPFLVVAGSVVVLVALEPDLGTTGVIALTAATMFFVAGANLLHLLVMAPLAAAGLLLYVVTNPYQMERITTFLDPWAQAAGDGYHTVQGLLALGLGGLFGEGLGQSRVPGGLRLPNADNDFVFAMVGQEFGLLGGGIIIGLFLLLAWRGIRVALRAPDTFGALLAVGITAMLAYQAFINIGVVVQLLPITGITLPFVSSGGTSIVVSFAAVGVLLSVSRETLVRGSIDDADLVAAGGTGGHIHPALAVLRSLAELQPDLDVRWLGGRRGQEASLVPAAGYRLERLWLRSLRTVDLSVAAALDPLRLLASMPQATVRLLRWRPDVIYATGGYVAIPTLAAAALVRVPSLLWEGNRLPGRSVRLTARLASALAVSFAGTAEQLPGHAYLTGTPVRSVRGLDRAEARAHLRLPADVPVVLLFGGSQSVRRFDAAVTDALPALVSRVAVLHLTGEAAYPDAQRRRSALPEGQRDRYRPYPVLRDDMAQALVAADLLVGRAGSSTLAEAAAVGLPMVVVPYPHAAAHQEANARELVAAGATQVVADEAFDADALIAACRIAEDADHLASMAAAARSLGRPDAAGATADLLMALAERRSPPDRAAIDARSRAVA